MRTLFLLSLLFLAATSAAANRFVEDLEARRAAEPNPDRRIDLLLEEVLWWREIDLDVALDRALQAVALADEHADASRAARARFQVAFIEGVHGRLDAVHAALERAEALIDDDDLELGVESLAARGVTASRFQRDYTDGFLLLRRALDLGEGRVSDATLAQVHTSLVWHFYFSNDFEASLGHALIALELTPPDPGNPQYAPRLRMAGSLYARLGSDKAVPYWERSLVLYEELGLRRGRALLLANFGDFLRQRGEHEEAVRLIRSAEEQTEDLQPYVLRLLGRALHGAGRLEEASRRYEQAIELYRVNGQPIGFHETRMEMAENLATPDETIAVLEDSLSWAVEHGEIRLERDISHRLAVVWERRGVPEKAIERELAADRLERELESRQWDEAVANAERTAAAYRQSRRLARERQRRERRLRRQELAALAGSALLVVLVLGTVTLYRGQRRQRRAHDELEALQSRTQDARLRAERLNEEKSRLMKIIAHDVRGPLLVVRGHLELLRLDVGADRLDATNSFSSLATATDELTGTLESLLGWALDSETQAMLDVGRVEVASAVGDVVEAVSSSAAFKGIELAVSLPDGVEVHADPRALCVVVRNLLSNAVKFTPPGGTVALRVEPMADRVGIRVRDTGIGLGREQQARLLDDASPLASTPGTGGEKGLGFGLRLVRQLLEEMDGALEVESTLGEGSEFRAVLRRWA